MRFNIWYLKILNMSKFLDDRKAKEKMPTSQLLVF